jgi:hypothetical protein
MRRQVTLAAAAAVLSACSGAPPATPPTEIPTPTPTVIAAPSPTATPLASPVSLVYPVADNEAWILFDAPADDPGEPEPHDATFLVRPDGSGLHRLVHEMTGSEVRATWSPDGSQVAYIQTRWPSDSWEDAGLYVINADGSDPHRVYECSAWCNTMDYPDWGSDGAIYVSIDSDVPDADSPPLTFEIWRIDPLTGVGRAVITREDEMTLEQPRLSPAGTQLAFARERIADGKWAIFVVDLEGGPERQLTDWDQYAAYPDWLDDGTISFNTNDLRIRNEEPHQICTVAVPGVRATAPDCIGTHAPDAPDNPVEAAHSRSMPDGGGMTYSLLLGGEAYLGLMKADGSDQRLVPGPVWGTFSELRPVAP